MIRVLRRLGIALGSLMIAWLAVGLLGGLLLQLFGVSPTPTFTTSSLVQTVIAIVLGGLIYRDIVRRERR